MADEQPDSQPSDEEFEREAKIVQQSLNYFNSLKTAAFANGFTILEGWVCPNCKQQNLFSHNGIESVPCMSCKQAHATNGPRSPSSSEIGVMHYILAVKMLRDVYAERARELPALADHEILALPLKMRTILARHRTQIVAETALKLDKLAEEMAALDATA